MIIYNHSTKNFTFKINILSKCDAFNTIASLKTYFKKFALRIW